MSVSSAPRLGVARTATPLSQVRTLVSLRWHMVRSVGVRALLTGLLVLLVLFAVSAHTSGVRAHRLLAVDVTVPFAAAYAGFVLLAVLTPLTAGGGTEIFPASQLVSFPVAPRTQFLTSLLLAPLNLAWVAQALTLTMLTGYVAADTPHPALAQTVTWTYILTVTVIGQAVAWSIVAVRATRRGRVAVWGAVIAMTILVVQGFRTLGDVLLLNSPSTTVALATLYASGLRWRQWLEPIGLLIALAAAAVWLGTRACAWALRRPSDRTARLDTRYHTRRSQRATVLAELLTIDVASVWRSTPLRRGMLVLTVLPGLFAALARLHWYQMVLLPGLVIAGAGLLFGVNAFALDGSGGVWLASLPIDPRSTYLSKFVVVLGTCVASAAVTVAAALLTVRGAPTPADLVALGGGLLAESLLVTAICLSWSIRRPHRAELKDSRDTPAPPGSMALYAAGLAVRTTFLGLVLVAVATLSGAPATGMLVLAVALWSTRSLLASRRAWLDEAIRARVLSTVAAG